MARDFALRTIEKWKVQDSSDLYGVDHWGKGYFSISKKGTLRVHPEKKRGESLDLKALVDQLQLSGISTPVLLRFSGVLKQRLREIHGAFTKAIDDSEYEGSYASI